MAACRHSTFAQWSLFFSQQGVVERCWEKFKPSLIVVAGHDDNRPQLMIEAST
jgi:murein tripeptide amidase MpaA